MWIHPSDATTDAVATEPSADEPVEEDDYEQINDGSKDNSDENPMKEIASTVRPSESPYNAIDAQRGQKIREDG